MAKLLTQVKSGLAQVFTRKAPSRTITTIPPTTSGSSTGPLMAQAQTLDEMLSPHGRSFSDLSADELSIRRRAILANTPFDLPNHRKFMNAVKEGWRVIGPIAFVVFTVWEVLISLAQHAPMSFQDSKGRGELRFEGLVNLGRCVQVHYRDKSYHAVVLAKASDWYHYSLNCTERWHHQISAAIVGTHDSCLPVPVFALDEQRAYDKKKARVENFTGPHFDDALRKSAYGHHMLVGGLMCLRADAWERFDQLSPSTRRRIRAKLKRLGLRRRGRPLPVM